MTRSIAWGKVTHADVLRAIQEYDRLGPEQFFSAHGFAPTTTYDLVWDKRRYPPKAVLGTAYEFSWARLMSSPRASALPPVISRAGRPAPSTCSESSDSPCSRDDQPT